jgi:beta-lactamase regulating signal transducer with metallopeptidase domain
MSAQAIVETLVAASGNAVAALVVKATLAMLAALLLIRLANGASASLRHLLAAASFGVLLLLPLAGIFVPERKITVVPAAPEAVTPSEAAAPAPAAQVAPTDAPTVSTSADSGLPRIAPMEVLSGIYLLGAIGFCVSLLAGIGRLHRVRGNAEVSVAGTRLANETARREGMPGGIEVAVTTELAVPMTFGWTHPVILLPAEAMDWEPAEMARAIRHELEHIARGDWATHILSRVALALYWPHPFAWVLWHRLRLEAERACDDAVLRSQGQAESYAEQLVALARRLRGRGAVPALSMATRSTLGQRVEAILDDRLRRAPRSRGTALFAAAAGLMCVLAIAPLRVVFAQSPDPLPTFDLDQTDVETDDADDDEGDPLDVALLEAAERGDIKKMRRLMDRGAKAGAVIHGDGTPLIAAARSGRLEALAMLIEAGVDVNRGVDGDGNALTMAAKGGHLEAVRMLLDHGADIDLGVRGDGNPLIMAAGAGRIEVVRLLVDRGAGIEKVVPGDENPLIHASEGGQAEVVRFLLAKGANVNARVWADFGRNGDRGEWRTALLMARRNGHEEVVRILLAAGARE